MDDEGVPRSITFVVRAFEKARTLEGPVKGVGFVDGEEQACTEIVPSASDEVDFDDSGVIGPGTAVDGEAWAAGERDFWEGEANEWIRESSSIFSSFSSRRPLSSRTSDSNDRTRSSNDSVYPRGNARRLNLSLVLHSNPTAEHWLQHGRMPSHLIFLLRHRSQAWAIRLWGLLPTLITFIGRIPGMVATRFVMPELSKYAVFKADRPNTTVELNDRARKKNWHGRSTR